MWTSSDAAAEGLTAEGLTQAAEGLTLLKANNKTGYFGVNLAKPHRLKPYKAQVWRNSKHVHLGYFATAEEAALCVARSPEGQAAAGRAAAAESQGTVPPMPSGAILKEEGTVPPVPHGAFVKEEGAVPPMPLGAFVKEEGVVPPMPPAAFIKVEVVVKEEEGSDGGLKRRRKK